MSIKQIYLKLTKYQSFQIFLDHCKPKTKKQAVSTFASWAIVNLY